MSPGKLAVVASLHNIVATCNGDSAKTSMAAWDKSDTTSTCRNVHFTSSQQSAVPTALTTPRQLAGSGAASASGDVLSFNDFVISLSSRHHELTLLMLL